MTTEFIPRNELILQAHDRLGLLHNKYTIDTDLDPARPLRLDPDETIVIDVSEADDYYHYSVNTYSGPVAESAWGWPQSSEWRDFDKRCRTTGKYTQPATLAETLKLAEKLLWHNDYRPDSPYDKVVVRTIKGVWTIHEGRLARFFPHDMVKWDQE